MKNSLYQTVRFRSPIVWASVGLAILVSLTMIGCSQGKKTQIAPPSRQVLTPLKIVVMQDRSGSIDSTRTPRISMAELDMLVGLLIQRSGEIAFGFIDEESNESFVRLRVTRAPVPPSEPSKQGNPFKVAEDLAVYRKEKAAFDTRDSDWQSETSRRVEVFKSAVQPLIEGMDRSRSTDVYGGINRADLFLSETELGTAAANGQTRVMVLITDGLDNARRAPEQLKSGATILIVNGSRSKGVLAEYSTEVFESVESAIRFVSEFQPQAVSTSTNNPPNRDLRHGD